MQLGPYKHLVHARSGGQRFEVAHPSPRLWRFDLDRRFAQGVKAIGVDPEVGIGDPYATRSGIVEPSDG
jgi:hypothetical protein